MPNTFEKVFIRGHIAHPHTKKIFTINTFSNVFWQRYFSIRVKIALEGCQSGQLLLHLLPSFVTPFLTNKEVATEENQQIFEEIERLPISIYTTLDAFIENRYQS